MYDWMEAGHLIPSQPIQWLPSSQVISPLEKRERIGSLSQWWPDTALGLAAKLADMQDEKAEKVHWRGECIWYTKRNRSKRPCTPERLGEWLQVPRDSPGFNVVAITFTEITFSSCTRVQWDFCKLKHTIKTKTSKNTWFHWSTLACVQHEAQRNLSRSLRSSRSLFKTAFTQINMSDICHPGSTTMQDREPHIPLRTWGPMPLAQRMAESPTSQPWLSLY